MSGRGLLAVNCLVMAIGCASGAARPSVRDQCHVLWQGPSGGMAVSRASTRTTALDSTGLGALVVTVVSSDSGQAVKSAAVRLVRPGTDLVIDSATTDAFGRAELQGRPGWYQLRASFIGYTRLHKEVVVRRGYADRVIVRLQGVVELCP